MKRFDIQVLRGLAVLAVMFSHFTSLLPGGFLGVDIFFVISGYVITESLFRLRKQESSNTSLLKMFWRRRFYRLFPALLLTIALTLLLAALVLIPSDLVTQVEMSFWSLIFAANVGVQLNSGGGYFDFQAGQNWFLHLWSLGVEEQFYLIFPLVFIAFLSSRFGGARKRGAFIIVLVFITLSFFASLVDGIAFDYQSLPTDFMSNLLLAATGYYSPLTRSWQFLAGALLALIVFKFGEREHRYVSFVGWVVLLPSFVLIPESEGYPSLITLIPVIGVILILLNSTHGKGCEKLANPLAWLGDRSYSAYLLHWPLWLFLGQTGLGEVAKVLFAFAATLFLSDFVYRKIEVPIIVFSRDRERSTGQVEERINGLFPSQETRVPKVQKFLLRLAALVTLIFLLIGVEGRLLHPLYLDTWAWAHSQESVRAYELVLEQGSPDMADFGSKSDGQQVLSECRFNAPTPDEEFLEQVTRCERKFGAGILVIGDSHATDLFGMLASNFETPFLISLSQAGCRPAIKEAPCPYESIERLLENNPGLFKRVLFEQAGFYLLINARGDTASREMFNSIHLADELPKFTVDEQSIRETLKYLRRLSFHAPVTWLEPRVEPHFTKTQIVKNGCNFDFSLRVGQIELQKKLEGAIATAVQSSNSDLMFFQQNRVVDFQFPEDFMNCDELYWSDGDHLSASGELKFGRRLPAYLLE